MEPEEIIAIAIREAFKCGKEEGEAYQRMWSNMNEKIEKAKKGEPDSPIGMYDGFFSQLQGMQVKVDTADPGTESEEVLFSVQSVPGNRIGSEPNEQIAALEKEVNELGRICEEKDAKITDYHKEVERLTAILEEKDTEIAKLRLMVPEIKPMQKDEHPDLYVFDECGKVVIGGMFFQDPTTRYIGKVLAVRDTYARVEIEDGPKQGEYNIPYDYLAPLVEEKK